MSPPDVSVGGRRGGGGGGCGGDRNSAADLLIEARSRPRRLPHRRKTKVRRLLHLLARRRRCFEIVVLKMLMLLVIIVCPSPDGHGYRGRCLVAVAFSAGGARRAGGGFGRGSPGGGDKRGNKKRKKSGRGRADASGRDGRRGRGGFGPAGTVGGVKRRTIQLGGGRAVDVYVPPDRLEQMEMGIGSDSSGPPTAPSKRTREELLEAYRSFYGTGDVLWPSSLRLASLLANCPSFADGRDVLEVGCGLGLCSASVAKFNRPRSLTLCDVDGEVLDVAVRTCEEILNERRETKSSEMEVGAVMATRVDRCQLDWNDESTWPSDRVGGVDLVIGSDVLYSEGAVGPLARLLAFLLVGDEGGSGFADDADEDVVVLRRALLVDPTNRLHRDAFAESCRGCGLSAETVPFPGGDDDFVLISVTPV